MNKKLQLRLIGALTGLLSAGFGIGGGALLVPAYHSIGGFSFKQAAGNSLATIVPIVTVGLLGRIAFHSDLSFTQAHFPFIIFVLTGGLCSTKLIGKINHENGLKAFFGFFLVLCGLKLAFGTNIIGLLLPSGLVETSFAGICMALSYGALVGSVAAMLGVGCGLAIVPFFVIVFDYSINQAIFQSLLTMFALTSFNAFVYKHIVGISLDGAKSAIIPALTGACIGLFISTRLPPHYIKLAFGYLLLIIGIRYSFLSIKNWINERNVYTKQTHRTVD